MSRDDKQSERAVSHWRWLLKPWTAIIAFATVIGAFFLNVNDVLSNARTFPSEFEKTSDQIKSWYFEDKFWNGYFTNHPEAYVDIEDLNLTEENFGLLIETENGIISGILSNEHICRVSPYDYFLIEGEVNFFSDSATVFVFDIFSGRKQKIAKLELIPRNGALEVIHKEGNEELFAKTRIALDPNINQWPEDFCIGKRDFLNSLAEKLAEEYSSEKQNKK